MINTARSKAELLFAENDKKAKKALSERQKERKKSLEHTAKLRNLRLAKEAADKELADTTSTKASTAKK